jgi:hypothetical protein
MATADGAGCNYPPDLPVFVKSRCGSGLFFDRDCLNDDRPNILGSATCGAMAYVALHSARYVEIWSADQARKLMTFKHKAYSSGKIAACFSRAAEDERLRAHFEGRDSPYTVNFPGLTDFLKFPGLETKEIRRERYERFKASRSALPQALQWIPPLITKLDNAQDMIFTGLALAVPLLKWIGARFVPFLGWALLANDLLNAFT